MGEVYEAADLSLGCSVALKTIRAYRSRGSEALEHFRREIQLARQITHPNVCRTFDFGHHVPDSPDSPAADELFFMTMELLTGETIAQRVNARGPFTSSEAFPIITQIAAGLDAAHAAGIVHRDFKSGNVMLVPAGEAGLRAVITDFGLASDIGSRRSLSSSVTLSVEGAGTPAYMAPEQVAGREVTPAVDIYALGIVMYEMMTGRLPFVGESPLATAVKRLLEPPVPPRILNAEIGRNWDHTILRCLERDPAERFSSAASVVTALRGARFLIRPGLPSKRFLSTAVVIAVGVGLVAAIVLWRNRYRPPPGGVMSQQSVAPSRAALRRSVAVFGFRNLSPRADLSWLNSALSETLSMELAAGEKLRVIPGENVERMKLELGLKSDGAVSSATIGRVRQHLASDLLVLGSYLIAGDERSAQIRLDVRVHDTATGEVVVRVTETGAEAELLALVARAGDRLRNQLGLGGLSLLQAEQLRAVRPSSAESVRLYSGGLEKLRRFDSISAVELLTRAIALDARQPLTHSALSSAWSSLGYDGKALMEAKIAFDLAGELSRSERLLVEGRYRQAAREWASAAEIFRTLWNYFPDNLEYGLLLAEVEALGGQGQRALATVNQLRRLPQPARDDPRVDLAEARAAESLSDFERERAAARRASLKGEATGARLLIVEARLAEWWACRNLGDFDGAVASSESARTISEQLGYRRGVALALNARATVLRQRGFLAEAFALDEKAMEVFRETGDKRGMSWSLNNMGRVEFERGDLARAEQTFEAQLKISREIGDASGVARTLANLGDIANESGRLSAASALYGESLTIARAAGEKRGIARALNTLGAVILLQGNLTKARSLHQESLEIANSIHDQRGAGWALDNLGGIELSQGRIAQAMALRERALAIFLKAEDGRSAALVLGGLSEVHLAKGDLSRARSSIERALKARKEVGDRWNLAKCRLALAGIALEEGKLDEAERLANEARAETTFQKTGDAEALVEVLSARILLAKGEVVRAIRVIDRADSLSTATENKFLRLSIRIVVNRMRGLAPGAASPQAQVRQLTEIIEESVEGGWKATELEAKLALGELHFGGRSEKVRGRELLESVLLEADRHGMKLIGTKASRALNSSQAFVRSGGPVATLQPREFGGINHAYE